VEITNEIREVCKNLPTPFLLLDLDILKDNYYKVKNVTTNNEVFYAVKANSHPRIVETLRDLGSSFDVASRGEIDLLLSLDVDPALISYGNTIKKEKDIAYAYQKGVNLFVLDSRMEAAKIARNAPGTNVFVRLEMSSTDSDWPLSKKFGTDIDHVKELLIYSRELGLKPLGISFHVGSQTYNKYKWKEAIVQAAEVFFDLKENYGIELNLLNLGGGMPVQHTRPIPTVEEISEVIRDSIDQSLDFVKNLRVLIEPGRSMVGNIGTLTSTVVLRSQKQQDEWVYLDAGVFHGLMETIENFRYEIIVDGKDDQETKIFTLAGPTCDSVDLIYDEVELAENITLDDLVYFKNTGAYTTGYASYFNGIEPPKVFILQDLI